MEREGAQPMTSTQSRPGAARDSVSGDAPAHVGASSAFPPATTDLFAGPDQRPDVRDGSTALNRDLAWVEFNARVLYQAMDESQPLLERAKFLAIFTSNLDEFVMKRVGWLKRVIDAGMHPETDGPSPAALLEAVRHNFERLEEAQGTCFEKSIRPALAREGIELVAYTDLSPDERRAIDEWFRVSVFPVLTPLAVDPGHKFPFISNLSQNLGVLLADGEGGPGDFARVKVPQGLPQWVRVPPAPGARPDPGRGRFVQLHDIIASNLDDLFPGMTILDVMPFRVTRSAAVEAEREDGDTILDAVEMQLRRMRFARVVRLEVPRDASPRMRRRLTEMMGLKPADTDTIQGLMDFRSLFEIADLPRPDLKHAPWTPVVPARLAESDDIFSVIRRGDVLVHHPYESFGATAERFIAEAAADPAVLAIKQTIYRTSRDSPFIAHLIRAAEAGKQVACLVELRARFDEGRNVRFAQMLEKAGVHVAYGVVGLKTHCKAALVVRREDDGLRCYAHLGTGNYNPSTAQLYTDLGLLTCDALITEDVVHLFNLLTGRSRRTDYHRLLVAPATMKAAFLERIRREAEFARAHARAESPVGGRIIAKMNALEDAATTRALYEASQAGVRITLLVRGFCCLRPGVPGLSENIEVISVIGRFLEHSRVFHFGAGRADPLEGEWYIGSADWMYRNLEQRVEAACPVSDRHARARLLRIFEIMSRDRQNAWELRPDGRYVRRTLPPDAPRPAPDAPELLGTFASLMREATHP